MLPPTRATRPSSSTDRPFVRTQIRRPSARIRPSSRSYGSPVFHQPLERRVDHRRALGVVCRDRLDDVGRIGTRLDAVDAIHLVRPYARSGPDVVLPAAGLADLLRALEQAPHVREVPLGSFAIGDVGVQLDDRDRLPILRALQRLAA